MKFRGHRRCSLCGHRWSYFETGSTACPDCGSHQSVSADDEPALHTDGPGELDLRSVRSMLWERPLREVAEAAQSAAREYRLSRGFVDGGELLPLDETVVAATELEHAGAHLRRAMAVGEATEAYFLGLLAGAEDGDRPDGVPASVRTARGLAAVDVVEAYHRDLRKWLEGRPHPEVRPVLAELRSRGKRVAALGGDVPPQQADALVASARELGDYLRTGDEANLASAADRLARLE